MAMTKKGSRSLIVDKRQYRWNIRRTDDDTGWNDYGMRTLLTIIVERYENPQSMLCVPYECWLGFKTGSSGAPLHLMKTGEAMQVTPGQVADLIRAALKTAALGL